ncbi:LacI family DNA-binding transcriptional regulator [Paremcibacter congregatus]|uniref:Transcriptional regulator n=1 Tax=Paremcibacter congregatus TaxID=2043170 RepID=A0A2G4YS31_9PROT|nr:LacI family DNA-binding transcriptional regulator [Paremcibacter congregatus]PHZ85149.1 transcriptional regulator [Paremcibacter congregatus]QDE27915.1 LacI family transcriptional regulator [Paremcibacter congregatus]
MSEVKRHKTHKKANISDVAKKAGVSIKTVSRFLNQEKYIREETKEKVISAIKALNYSPNVQARGLRGERSYMIGLFVDDLSGDYISKVQRGILSGCEKEGSHLVVEVLSERGSAAKVRDLLSCVRFDGVVLTPPVCDDMAVLNALRDAAIPVVRLGAGIPVPDMALAEIDDYQAARDMTDYLISLGHHSIGFIKGDPSHGSAHERERGYIHALQAAGIAVKSELIVQGMFCHSGGREAAATLLALDPRPTAIFSSNDEMAIGAMASIDAQGMKIPDDISIVGFDDHVMSQIVLPPLTTIHQPIEQMATEAVSLLGKVTKQDKSMLQTRIFLEYDLKVRKSAAPLSC